MNINGPSFLSLAGIKIDQTLIQMLKLVIWYFASMKLIQHKLKQVEEVDLLH